MEAMYVRDFPDPVPEVTTRPSALHAQTNSFQLMLIDRVALKNVRRRGMKYARLSYTLDAPNLFVGRVELEERVGPELTIGQCRMHRLANLWISDVDEALDVIGVIGTTQSRRSKTFIDSSPHSAV